MASHGTPASIFVRLLALASTVLPLSAQGGGSSGVIPNEGCSEMNLRKPFSLGDRPSEYIDAGAGETTVNVYGGATRELRMPPRQDGMYGIARLYHATLQFDVSYTALDGTGDSLKGGSLPVPSVDPADLVLFDDLDGVVLQPRPGTMPGLYLYYDDAEESYYHYGSPLESGANPQSTAVYPPSEGEGLGGTIIRTTNLSGAQLWYYGNATPPYIEIKHVDGSIARFEPIDPYRTSYSTPGQLWRVTNVRDPYDNVATYVYDSAFRLIRIEFPSGLKQIFDYAPSWGTWSSGDRLEVRYTQTSGTTTTNLTDLTWGIVFYGTSGSSGGWHFGKRLYRTYSASRQILKEVSAGTPYSISTSSHVTGQVVHTLSFNNSTRVVTETQSIHTGTAFAETLSTTSGLADRDVLAIAFSGGTDRRVVSATDALTQQAVAFTYTGAGVRTTDLNGASLYAIIATDSLGAERRFEYDVNTGRIYSIIHTPSDDAAGRPRAHDSTNSGIGGVASSDVEPTKVTIYNIFDSTCVCQKPIEVREISRRGSTDYTRVTTFEYFTDSKLLKTRTVTNPATVGTLPLPGTVSWQYTYVRAMTTSQAWGGWLPATEVTPDGTYSYTYSNWLNRSDQLLHGQMAGTVVRSIDDVRIQTSLTSGSTTTTTTVSETLHRNLSNSPGGYSQTGSVSGQPRAVVDGDGIVSTWEYSSEGWLNVSYEHGGVEKTVFTRGVSGNVETMTTNAGSTGSGSLAATIHYPDQSGDGLVYTASTSSGGLQRTSKFFHDRFGHLAVVQKNNLDSAGNQPNKHTGSGSAARAWVETQSHFLHHWLMEEYADRKPRDEGAGTGQFLKTAYVYLSNGRLDYVVQPNGSRTDLDIDGFGTLYRSVTQDPSATSSVTSRKLFINPFLEVTGSYESTGSDHLWTTLTRNSAGAITQIVEPSTTAPSGYDGATGGAIHQFEIDQMGRAVEARAYTGTPSTTTLATKREVHFDQLDRQIWQHDLVLGFGSGDHHVAWQYASAKATQLSTVKRTGIADQTFSYNNATSPVTGFLTTINDGFSSGGNTLTYAYHAQTAFVSGITRVDQDPASSTPRTTTTTYGVDPFGQVIALHEGSGTTLDHAYAYDSLGRVDRYTDPLGRLQKFLTDGLGRVVEHTRVGDSSAYIANAVVFEDSGASDGRTKISRYDGLGNVTISHADFAGRPFIVQNPGGNTAPTSSAKNQSMCLYAEYDSASRVKAVYDGDGGKTEFWRDGPGRMIQRQLTVAGSNHARFNTKDVLLRDAIGRLYETNILGSTNTGSSPNHALSIVDEEFDVDSIGRIHEERYEFPYFAPVNELKVSSTFAGGSPFRSDLDYADNLTGANAALSAPINLDFDHDSIGRLTSIEWNVSGGSGQQPLAEYTWVGGLRRNRTVHYGSSQYPQGVTAYDYDAYNRLTQIQDDVWTTSTPPTTPTSKFEYVYDAASNLLKEKYTKMDGSVGDRFAYDAYHRLTAASMGVNTTTMNASSDPTGWSSGAMHEYLTYGLDEANNRTGTTSWVSSTAQSTAYTLQDSGHAQGQSNRYDTVTLPGASPVTYEYDDRGNLRYDGRFLFQYDFLNRLQEVWKVTLVEGETGDAEKFAVIEQTALRDSKQEVKDSIPDLMSRLPREHKDPVFRNRLKARLHGGVIRLHPPQQGGGGMSGMMLNPQWLITDADLELAAVYGYDAFNRRVMSIIVDPDWSDTAFHTYDGWRQVVQYTLDSTNSSYKAAPTKEFVWGSQLDELLSYRRRVGSTGNYSWENYFILHGGQDTAAKLVNASGAVVEQYEYDPYGRASVYDGSGTAMGNSAYGLPFLWKSIRLDNETGLLYMRNRYYSVELGRYLTGDLLGVWGDTLNGGNQYAYCCNNALVLADPMGLQAGAAGGSLPPSGNTLFTNDHRDATRLGVGDFNLPAPKVPPTTLSGAPAAAASDVGLMTSIDGKVTCKQVSRDKCVKAQAAAGGPTTGPSWQGGSDCLTKENCPQCWECTASGNVSVQAYHDRNRSWMADKTGNDVSRVLNHEQGHLHIAIMMANAYSSSYSYTVLSCSQKAAADAAAKLASDNLKGIQSLANWRNRGSQNSYEGETANGNKPGPQAEWDRLFSDVRR